MIQIEVTNKCNFKCYFCSSRNIEHHSTIELDKFKELIDNCQDMEIAKIYLTPSEGEIFMDPTIIDKLSYMNNKFNIEFVTNFTRITKKQIDFLTTIKNLTIIVSDYGDGDEKLFNYMTRTENQFNKYKDNLKYAAQLGLTIIKSSRNLSYDFSYDNTNDSTIEEVYRSRQELSKLKNGVCSMLYAPRILSNGDFIQCRCSGGLQDLDDDLYIGNIYKSKFSDLYQHIKRYNIFKDQQKNIYNEYCQNCDSFVKTEAPTINMLKKYISIKKKYDLSN